MELCELLLILLVAIQALSVVEGRPSVTGTESSSNTSYLEVDQFLTSYGYYPSSGLFPAQERTPSLRKHSERTKALKLFQKFYQLPQSGELDKETRQLMQSPRCGNPDIISNPSITGTALDLDVEEDEAVSQIRNEKENLDREKAGVNVDRGRRSVDMSRKTRVKRSRDEFREDERILSRWNTKVVRWSITVPSQQKKFRFFQRAFMAASLKFWAKVVPITFVEATDEMIQQHQIDLEIVFHSFANMNWSDEWHQGYSGRNEIIYERQGRKGSKKKTYSHAHAMVPVSDGLSPMHRDIHFDEDYDWNIMNFFSVALHQIGHVLGLGHTNHKGAIMNPYHRGVTQFSLADLRAVKQLYGYQGGRLHPHICKAKIREVDDVFRAPHHPYAQSFYIVSGKRVQLTSKRENVRSYYRFKKTFPNAPSKYDVAFSGSVNNTVIFLTGDKLVVHDAPGKGFGIIPLNKSLPETPKFAVNQDFNGRQFTHLYGENYTWLFEFDGRTVVEHQPYKITPRVAELLSNAKFAVQWIDGIIYIVMRNRYATVEVNPLNPGTENILSTFEGTLYWLRTLLCRPSKCKTDNSISGLPTPCPMSMNHGQSNKRWGTSRARLMLLAILSLFVEMHL